MSGLGATRRELDNGMIVLHARNPHAASVAISLSVAGGACMEAPSQAGLATLVARGLTRGTTGRDKTQIGEELDFRGALMAGSSGRHACGLGARARATDMEEVLALLAECAREATFPDDEVEKLRGDRLTALREDEDDPATVAMLEFRARAYDASHPYARRFHGSIESVEGLRGADFRDFHRATFVPGAALLVVVGDVDLQATLAAVSNAFGDWSGEAGPGGFRQALPEIPDAAMPDRAIRVDAPLPAKAQVEIVLGHPGIRRTDDRYYDATVMNSVLGSFAMGGRLGRAVREERGLAYHVSSGFSAGPGPGPFLVRAGVQPEHVDRAVEQMRLEIRRMRDEPVEETELDDARSAIVRSLPRALESNEGVARVLHQIELYDLGLDHVERFPAYIESVTPARGRAAAESLLDPDRYVLVAAGPGADEASGS